MACGQSSPFSWMFFLSLGKDYDEDEVMCVGRVVHRFTAIHQALGHSSGHPFNSNARSRPCHLDLRHCTLVTVARLLWYGTRMSCMQTPGVRARA